MGQLNHLPNALESVQPQRLGSTFGVGDPLQSQPTPLILRIDGDLRPR